MPITSLSEENEVHLAEIKGFVTPLLYFLPRSIPDYTDHGITHSENLLRLLDNFQENLETECFTEEELFIFKASIWLHDIGCLLCTQEEKEKHGRISANLLESDSFNFIRSIIPKDILTCISYVILSHQHSYSFTDIPKESIHPKVRLPLLCAIFRLIDACDISAARVNPNLYIILKENDLIKEENKKFWDAHTKIVSVVFNKEFIDIFVENSEVTKLLIDHLNVDLRYINDIFNDYPRWNKYEVRIHERDFTWKEDL